MAPWRPDMQFASQQLSTQVLNPTTESKRRHLRSTQHTCLRVEPHGMIQKGLLELVDRSDSDWAGDSATRQSATGYHCNVQGVTMCNRSLKHSSISLSSCEAEFYAASAQTVMTFSMKESEAPPGRPDMSAGTSTTTPQTAPVENRRFSSQLAL